jgi:hypothetical protein
MKTLSRQPFSHGLPISFVLETRDMTFGRSQRGADCGRVAQIIPVAAGVRCYEFRFSAPDWLRDASAPRRFRGGELAAVPSLRAGKSNIANGKWHQSITAAKRRPRVLTRSSLKPNSSITVS